VLTAERPHHARHLTTTNVQSSLTTVAATAPRDVVVTSQPATMHGQRR
jgi:hypothetical protein